MMDVNLSVNLSSKEKLMDIFYLLLEGKPCINNEESKEVAGAYINCWVKAKDETTAKDKAMKYINSQGWEPLNIEEIYITSRERYVDKPDSLECFEQAINCGVGAIIYTWPIDDEGDI
jgi:hypothetical protein